MKPFNWRRSLKALGLALVAIVLLVFVSLWGLLGTETGSRWVLARVPGLQLQNFNGRLGGQWQADHLIWQQEATRVEIDKPVLDWSPGCLLKMTLCIEQLHADQVRLQLAPANDAAQSEPLQLPDLKLPLAIRLGDVRIGSLSLDGNEQVAIQ